MNLRQLIAVPIALALQLSPLPAADKFLPVPTQTIYPGDIIEDDQLIERTFSQAAVGRYPAVEERLVLVGKVARRTLLPGKPIPANGVKEPDLVSRGGAVLAIYQSRGLTITSLVSPLKGGAAGDIVEARNVDSGQIIRGMVQPDGTIRVGFAP
jgi:flagella basal body P-ring formation protein FlgA